MNFFLAMLIGLSLITTQEIFCHDRPLERLGQATRRAAELTEEYANRELLSIFATKTLTPDQKQDLLAIKAFLESNQKPAVFSTFHRSSEDSGLLDFCNLLIDIHIEAPLRAKQKKAETEALTLEAKMRHLKLETTASRHQKDRSPKHFRNRFC